MLGRMLVDRVAVKGCQGCTHPEYAGGQIFNIILAYASRAEAQRRRIFKPKILNTAPTPG